MNQVELTQHLSTLITEWENEVIEFKLAVTDYKTDKIGEYFSALANGLFRIVVTTKDSRHRIPSQSKCNQAKMVFCIGGF